MSLIFATTTILFCGIDVGTPMYEENIRSNPYASRLSRSKKKVTFNTVIIIYYKLKINTFFFIKI